MGEEQKKAPGEKENVDEKNQSSVGEGEKKEAEGEEKADPPPPPPPPEEVVMKVYMHCGACARKVKRCLGRFEGVEGVVANSGDHMVVVKGKKAAENPIRVAERVQRKCRRKVELISPIPSPEPEMKDEVIKEVEPKPSVVEPQVITVVLKVYMHCEACSKEIKKRILMWKGVQDAEPDLKSSEVRVKGVFDPEKLVEYIRKRIGKYAVVLKQELPPPPAEQKPEEEIKPEGEKNNVENKPEGEEEVRSADKATEAKGEGKEETEKEAEEKDKEAVAATVGIPVAAAAIVDSSGKVVGVMRKNALHYYHPLYPFEHSYPPQIFSDENPNACIVM